MTLTTKALRTLLHPVIRISVDDFPAMAAERFGEDADLDATWRVFEPVARTLVDSFHLTLDDPNLSTLVPRLEEYQPEVRGIAYEGAGMGLTLLDVMLPGRARLARFLHGPASSYRCLVYIGAGLVLARAPVSPARFLARHDPLLRWFVMDGYGFHDGFFRWRRTVNRCQVPSRVRGYARRAYDHGLGRSVWFFTGADGDRITATINSFPADRRADLWGGIGLACAYAAGVVDAKVIDGLLEASEPHSPHMAAGVAMAAIFRQQAGHAAEHTDLACQVVWDRSAAELADLVQHIAVGAPGSGQVADGERKPAYETWRMEIRDAWARHKGLAPAALGSRGGMT